MSPTTRKRRQYGTGSVFQRKSDGRWLGVIQAGWTTKGTRRTITVTARTEAEAKRRLRDKLREIERDGLPTGDVSSRTTVKAWAEIWLDLIVTKQRPKAYATTRSAVHRWIVPTIGHKQLAALTPGDVRAVARAQREAGRTSTTALRTHQTLTQMLRAAMLDGHAVPPRVLLVDRPGVAANDRTAMTTPEAVAILEQATALPHGSRWVAALLQGMRQGECLGLTWSCVDLEREIVDVSWQLQGLPYVDTKRKSLGFRVPDDYEARQLEGRMHLVRPKSTAGYRVIPLVPWMKTALEAWRLIAPESPHGLVWPTVDGRPANEKADLEEWKALQVTAGVGHPAGRFYVLHEARHTTATLLLEAGIDPEVIKSILGHSSIITSRGYMHTSKEMAAAALASVAHRLELVSR